MSGYFFHVYKEENEKWQQTLNMQRGELPAMREVLLEMIRNKPGEKHLDNARYLNRELESQEELIDQISEKIKSQQGKLQILDEENKSQANSGTAFYDQEELRDELLRFEKNYLSLKQKIQTYILSVL